MIEYKGKQTMTYAVAASLFLHGALVLVALLLLTKSVEEIKTDKLLLELVGMVANRQREESTPSSAASTTTPVQKTVQKEETKKTPVKKIKAISADSPVQIEQREELATSSSRSSESKRDSDLQKQQTLNNELEELKKYQVKLTKKIKSNLVYPSDARRRGYEGVTAVRFVVTDSGMIQPGTLIVARSSGYPMLDTNALKSVRDSEPFDRPPRTMPVEIDLGFSS
ncbi:energy transducer TonB [Herminiimonas glaciei]|uniref:Energy transducer TonB n=1 Tax=Herminiimonas glaciei TaxID=523788 RepID=A0ABW2I6W5_9BURK